MLRDVKDFEGVHSSQSFLSNCEELFYRLLPNFQRLNVPIDAVCGRNLQNRLFICETSNRTLLPRIAITVGTERSEDSLQSFITMTPQQCRTENSSIKHYNPRSLCTYLLLPRFSILLRLHHATTLHLQYPQRSTKKRLHQTKTEKTAVQLLGHCQVYSIAGNHHNYCRRGPRTPSRGSQRRNLVHVGR